jgi:guanylate kinase
VIAGPSGVGKGTLVKALQDRFPQLFVSVSATTRKPREGERDGEHYHFVSDAEFDSLAESGGLLEWARYAHTRYGTPREPVTSALARGQKVILEIDLQGARQVRSTCPGALQVFIAPPSLAELEARLRGRGTETDEQIATHLLAAEAEMAAAGEFDAVVVNDRVERATDELVGLLGLGDSPLKQEEVKADN